MNIFDMKNQQAHNRCGENEKKRMRQKHFKGKWISIKREIKLREYKMHTFVDVMEKITGTEKMYMKTDLCYRNHRRCKKQKKEMFVV